MFKKKPNFKSLAPLRSSDRRKLVDQIIKQYDLTPPQEQPEASETSDQPTITAFRNAILPDGALSANFATTAGPDLKTIKGVVYVGAHPDSKQRILWIKLDDGLLVPTVYTLWRYPGLIPLLHTPAIVVQKMREGADLNTPGLARGPPFPANAKKGSIVAIASYEEPSVPMAVGVCEIDVSALTEVRGQKGHAVRPLHSEGDEVWSWSQLGQGGEPAPDHIDGWFQPGSDVSDQMGRLNTVDDLGEDEGEEEGGVSIQLPATSSAAEPDATGPSKEWTTQEIDDAFRNAFLFSLHKAKSENRGDNHGIPFPLSQSQFVSTLITPFLPAYTAEDAAALQIKRTSWKNVKKFIKVLDKQLLVKSKDRNGGETVVLDVDFEDQSVQSFTPYRLPKKENPTPNKTDGSPGQSVDSDTSVGQQLQRLTLLKPSQKLSPLFEKTGSQDMYLPHELKPIVTKYIEAEDLISTTNKRLVKVNPVLANAVFDSSSSLDNEVLAKGFVTRDVLVERVVTACSPYWIILRNEESRQNAKAKSGKPPTVKIQLETRSGNKTATKVSGLEPYFVHAQALADELQKTCASSTSVNQLQGSSPKAPLMEVMVQGPQKEAVLKALGKRGVKKEWIEIVDKTKGKKK